MRASTCLPWLFTVACAVLGPASCADASETTIRLHGSNTVGQRLAPALVREWAASLGLAESGSVTTAPEEATLRFEGGGRRLVAEIASHGTGTGYLDLVEGRCDLWMASRPATAAERAGAQRVGPLDAPEQEHVVALDGLAVIVHPSNPLRALTVDQVRELFSGRVGDWSQLGGRSGAVALHARDDRSGTFDSFRSLVLRDAPLSTRAQRYESTDALAAQVAADPNAIGFVGLAGVGGARALAIADRGTRALAPGRVSVGTEDYVLSRRLFLYGTRESSSAARAFVEFVVGPRGQQVVERIGFVSQEVVAVEVPPRPDLSAEYRALTEGARRLSLNFRFGARAAALDTKALRDAERLAAYLQTQGAAGLDLILVGFSDGHEIDVYHALSLSNDRADLVAAALLEHGVGPRRVRGMGAAAPVASNDTEAGRARNRRVEVWVRPRDGALAATGSH
jgi:phosphate transport system substrate-binding protein